MEEAVEGATAPGSASSGELVGMYTVASVSVVEAAGWLLLVAVVAFAVPYLCADRYEVPRGAYVAILSGVSVLLWSAAMFFVGSGIGQALAWHWRSGLLLAPVVAAIPAVGITRLPATRPRHGKTLVRALGWDAAMYGAAEGALLSALPAFLGWQLVHAMAAPDEPGTGTAWATALAASVLVIVVHHLGYPEFRHPQGLVMASVACGLLTVGYLVTGSVWTPVVGHILLHAAAVVRGNALPPHGDTGRATDAGSVPLATV